MNQDTPSNNDNPCFDDAGRLTAPKYDDVYFSVQDGLAETRYVFLDGNELAKRFAALNAGQVFTIGETGFGTGLNFFAAWQLFEQHAPKDARLEFVSVEGLPLDAQTISRAVSPWPELSPYRAALLAQWDSIWPGMHRLRFDEGRVCLTLLVGQVAQAMSGIDAAVDAWFLDGFAPSRNPEMWTGEVFREVARLSASDATLATYTAAGFVRRGLEAVGFDIEKRPGFGTKRDMTAGRFNDGGHAANEGGRPSSLPLAQGRSVVVIGGSLAGAFAARSLAERGVSVTVIERQALINGELPSLAPRVAVLQPKVTDQGDLGGQRLREGYALTKRWLGSDAGLLASCDWLACGTFQAAIDERAERRLRRFIDQFGETGLCRWIEADQTECELGIELPIGGVVVDGAGVLRPAGLCAGLLNHPLIEVRDGQHVAALERIGDQWQVSCAGAEAIKAEAVIVANALDAARFEPTRQLELCPVRGQVTLLDAARQSGALSLLRRAVFYGGYVTPAIDGVQMLGASFVPNDTETDWRDREHADVCDKLARVLPDEAQWLRAIDSPAGWVGLRVTTPRHRAYAQQINTGLYVSLGHGSHGIASAAHAGDHLAAMMAGAPCSAR